MPSLIGGSWSRTRRVAACESLRLLVGAALELVRANQLEQCVPPLAKETPGSIVIIAEALPLR